MSNAEKTVRLKQCLKTIGVHSPELTRFIKRSLELDKKAKQLKRKMEAVDKRLERMQAKVVVMLLS
jgi:chaperonin cofactor prefoldin